MTAAAEALSGAVSTGTWDGALSGAFTAVATFGIDRSGIAANFAAATLAKGVVGGISAELQGGKFGHGFLSSGVTAAVSPVIQSLGQDTISQIIASAVVGGTVSELSGGKFANGAATAAMQFAVNQVGSGRDGERTLEEIGQLSPEEFETYMDSFPEPTLNLETAIAFQPPSFPRWFVNGAAGLGDGLTLGLTRRARGAWNIDGGVDRSSTAYAVGSWGAAGVGGARLAYMGAAKGYSLVAPSGAAASAFRERLKRFSRLGFGKSWRKPNLSKYPSDAALRAAAGRTNPYINAYGAGTVYSGATAPCHSNRC